VRAGGRHLDAVSAAHLPHLLHNADFPPPPRRLVRI
jgi:hypothetical protein